MPRGVYPRSNPTTATCADCGKSLSSNKLTRCRPCDVKARTRPLAERFWEKVDRSAGPESCWLFQGARNASGYGVLHRSDGTRLAHRVAYELTNGPIPDGLHLCHSCDNPPCCNPSHVSPGTDQDNSDDRHARGRATPPPLMVGERGTNAKLTAEQVIAIRAAFDSGEATLKDLQERYGRSHGCIYLIVKRVNWKHLP